MLSNEVSSAFIRESREYCSVNEFHSKVFLFLALSPSKVILLSLISENVVCNWLIRLPTKISQTIHPVVASIPVKNPTPNRENNKTYDIDS